MPVENVASASNKFDIPVVDNCIDVFTVNCAFITTDSIDVFPIYCTFITTDNIDVFTVDCALLTTDSIDVFTVDCALITTDSIDVFTVDCALITTDSELEKPLCFHVERKNTVFHCANPFPQGYRKEQEYFL